MGAWDGGPPRVAADLSSLSGDSLIGAKVTLRTLLGETITGELFAFDKTTNCVVIQEKSDDKKPGCVRILKANFIKEMVEAQERPVDVELDMKLPPIDIARCQAREAAALKSAEEEAKKIGVGVSEVAQDIFDALSKTLPCKWNDKVIMVMDEVRIEDPYTVESCQGSNTTMVNRVRKVLEGEKARITKERAAGK